MCMYMYVHSVASTETLETWENLYFNTDFLKFQKFQLKILSSLC